VSFITGAIAQNTEVYDIISTTGSIIDKRSGKPLQVGDKVSFQTELEFSSLHDRAVLLNSEKSKYFLELPKSSFANSQLTVVSNQALMPVKGRPSLQTGTRGPCFFNTVRVSQENFRKYLQVDTFTIIGSYFDFCVIDQDAERYDLKFTYMYDDDVIDYVVSDFIIHKNELKIQGASIPECDIYLIDGDTEIKVTDYSIAIFFVEKEQLFAEFDSLLKALNHKKVDNSATRRILQQYCTDVYGMIDPLILNRTLLEYLDI